MVGRGAGGRGGGGGPERMVVDEERMRPSGVQDVEGRDEPRGGGGGRSAPASDIRREDIVRGESVVMDRAEGGGAEGGAEGGEPLSGEAVKGLWERHRRWVAAIVLAYKPWWVDADDVLQDVALAVVRKGHTVRDAQAFKGWLRMVTINAARLTARTSGPPISAGVGGGAESRGGGGVGEGQAGHAAPAEMVIEADRGRAVARLLSRLPEGYREPLVLKAVEGLSYRQIGRILDLPETTVETRIARGRRMLRELAEKEQIL